MNRGKIKHKYNNNNINSAHQVITILRLGKDSSHKPTSFAVRTCCSDIRLNDSVLCVHFFPLFFEIYIYLCLCSLCGELIVFRIEQTNRSPKVLKVVTSNYKETNKRKHKKSNRIGRIIYSFYETKQGAVNWSFKYWLEILNIDFWQNRGNKRILLWQTKI